jgi:nucleotidyltransferase/DNA polymerase involved in DNA repair
MHKILHVDGDNFFVSCEVARFPHLKGKPVIVGEERGIACAMSYEAKRLGITRAMPIFEIREKFPHVAVLPAHFELYEQYADKLATILEKYCSEVERYSIDECFALVSQADILLHGHGNGENHRDKAELNFLEIVKKEAELCLGITLSFGLANTKTLAKIGSKLEKPSGAVVIDENRRVEILNKTDIGSVWGIGRAISQKLTSYNVKTAHDFTRLDPSFVKKNFGEGTLATWHELRGEARFETESGPRIPKSLQSTRSFGRAVYAAGTSATNIKERSFLLSELSNHAENLCTRLRSHGLKVSRFSFFIKKNTDYNRYLSHEIELGYYTDNASDIIRAIHKAANAMLSSEAVLRAANFGVKFKATGISVHGLRPAETVQDDLFATQSTLDTRSKYLEAVDSLQKRFGAGSIYLCSSLESKKRRLAAFNERNSRNHFIYGLPLPYMGEVV